MGQRPMPPTKMIVKNERLYSAYFKSKLLFCGNLQSRRGEGFFFCTHNLGFNSSIVECHSLVVLSRVVYPRNQVERVKNHIIAIAGHLMKMRIARLQKLLLMHFIIQVC